MLQNRSGRAAFAQTAALEALDRLDAGVLVVNRSRRVVHAEVDRISGTIDPLAADRIADTLGM